MTAKLAGLCAVCGSRWQMTDRRRRYCSPRCFEQARREYDKRRKRAPSAEERARRQESSRRYKQTERSKALVAAYMARPETKARRAVLLQANEEARYRGVNVRTVLMEWSVPLGRVKARRAVQYRACARCGKQRAKLRYCSRRCFIAARKVYNRVWHRQWYRERRQQMGQGT